jgi:phospholipase C
MKPTEKLSQILIACVMISLLGLGGCRGLADGTVTPTPPVTSLKPINHIIFMAQENRSFDTYFGELPAYWTANGYPQDQSSFHGMPATASNPTFSGTGTVSAFHIASVCTENLTPSWDESHLDWNLADPTSSTPLLNGYVYNAAKFAMDSGYTDTAGIRAMGYYDATDLPYYYFMASNFATSDMWFSPVMDRTQLNRMYLFAATSQGDAYPPGTPPANTGALTAPTIFDSLTQAGISWKIYTSDNDCSGNDTPFPCTYLTQFANYTPPNQLPANVVPLEPNFANDLAAGTLPAVAMIEGGYNSGRDEHPDNNVQVGAQYVSSLINEFMASPSWKDSAFILTYDEAGGLYDHIPPQSAVSPDGIAPRDLLPGDICTTNPGTTNCDFNITGFRVPMLVISPFTKKNYVSHTVADYTAILKLIEARFGLQPLTKRDAAQIDMTEFFDFQNVPWATPPSNVPTQPTNGQCTPQTLQ